MTKFTFDIIRIEQICENINDKQKIYKNTTENLYREVAGSKNIWFDPASDTFNRRVLNDQAKLNDALENINKYYRNLSDFSNNLNDIFVSAGAGRGTIGYDTAYISLAKEKFSSINTYLSRAINYLEPGEPYDFRKNYAIREIYGSVISINKSISDIKDKVKEIERDVENLVSVHRTKERAIEFTPIDSNVTRFNWTVVPVMKNSSPQVIRVVTYDKVADIGKVDTSNMSLESANMYTTANNGVIETEIKGNTEVINATTYVPNTENVENKAAAGQLHVASDMSLSIGPVANTSNDTDMKVASDMSLSIENKDSVTNGTSIQTESDKELTVSQVDNKAADTSIQSTEDVLISNGSVENSTLDVDIQSGSDKSLNTATVTNSSNSTEIQSSMDKSINTSVVTNTTSTANMVRSSDASVNTATIKESTINSGQMKQSTSSDKVMDEIKSSTN